MEEKKRKPYNPIVEFDKDGTPMMCLDMVSVGEDESGITIDLTNTINIYGKIEQTWVYNYETHKWEQALEDNQYYDGEEIK